jgi:hypothetical protein
MYKAKVLADSISPHGCRLITVEATYWRAIHSEQMTHREESRNSASTRAIPLWVQIWNLLTEPFIPEKFGINERGMQSGKFHEGEKHEQAKKIWLSNRDKALTGAIELTLGTELAGEMFGYKPGAEYATAESMLSHFEEFKAAIPKTNQDVDLSETELLNVHKQLAGRGLEAYMFHTTVITATEWDNYFALRIHPDAQGEINRIATLIREQIEASTPRELSFGQWHTPYVKPGEYDDPMDAVRNSAARCAAVSYNRQDAKKTQAEVTERYFQLRDGGHMSPLEHQARPSSAEQWTARDAAGQVYLTQAKELGIDDLEVAQFVDRLHFEGNFRGWHQHRKDVVNEDNFAKVVVA